MKLKSTQFDIERNKFKASKRLQKTCLEIFKHKIQ